MSLSFCVFGGEQYQRMALSGLYIIYQTPLVHSFSSMWLKPYTSFRPQVLVSIHEAKKIKKPTWYGLIWQTMIMLKELQHALFSLYTFVRKMTHFFFFLRAFSTALHSGSLSPHVESKMKNWYSNSSSKSSSNCQNATIAFHKWKATVQSSAEY